MTTRRAVLGLAALGVPLWQLVSAPPGRLGPSRKSWSTSTGT